MKTLLSEDSLVFDPPGLGCVIYLPGLPGGSSKIHDRSPYGNVGTITGATWKRLPSGLWYLSFDGSDDEVDCGNNAVFRPTSGDLAVEIWVKPDATQNDYTNIVSVHYNGWALEQSGSNVNQYYFAYFNGSGWEGQSTLTTLTADIWQHLFVQKRGTNIEHYLNGVLSASESGVADSFVYSEALSLFLGRRSRPAPTPPATYWGGGLALVRVYLRSFSALDVQNSFNREKHLFGVW